MIFYLLLALLAMVPQVTVTGGFNVSSSVRLTWNASAGAATYNVLRGAIGGPYTPIASGVAVTTYTDSAVPPHAQACYVVQAVNSKGTSGNSNEACAQMP